MGWLPLHGPTGITDRAYGGVGAKAQRSMNQRPSIANSRA